MTVSATCLFWQHRLSNNVNEEISLLPNLPVLRNCFWCFCEETVLLASLFVHKETVLLCHLWILIAMSPHQSGGGGKASHPWQVGGKLPRAWFGVECRVSRPCDTFLLTGGRLEDYAEGACLLSNTCTVQWVPSFSIFFCSQHSSLCWVGRLWFSPVIPFKKKNFFLVDVVMLHGVAMMPDSVSFPFQKCRGFLAGDGVMGWLKVAVCLRN